MRNAYALLGLAFIIVFVGAYFVYQEAKAPSTLEEDIATSETDIAKEVATTTMKLTLTSPAFKDGGSIPSKYTCDGESVNPELSITDAPEGTKSFVLVMDDPDIPDSVKQSMGIEKFDHWVLYNIPADTTVIPENASLGTTGLNSSGKSAYTGPCPPDREHRYFLRLYALSGTLNFIKAPTLNEVEEAAKGMALASTTLMGRYERISQ